MFTSFVTLLAGLISVVNPIGAMPVFLSLTKDETAAQRGKIALKCCGFFVVILVIAYWVGVYILDFFSITIDAMRIAGGLIILGSGTALLKGEFAKNRAIDKKVKREAEQKDDISLTPLAIPMLAGPGSISFLIGVKAECQTSVDYAMSLLAVLATGLVTYAFLMIAPKFLKYLGKSGFNSLSRVLGFIVMSIGIQYIIRGVSSVAVGLVGG